ncbi:tail spike protein [Acinetobacter phage Bestia]|nr:tail spike protein [Acinetobacter phage Bestia]
MADVLVTGIKIGDMPLKGTVSGNEKLPTGDVGDLAVTPNQIKDFTIQEGNLVNQEQLDDAIESVEQTSSGLAGRVRTLEDRTSNVNNTSDLDKPISNATQAALNAKADKVDVYDKSQVYNKTEVSALLDLKANANQVVSSFNGQTGSVTLDQSDLVNVGGNFTATPIFQNVPKLTKPDGSSIPEIDSQIQPLVNSIVVHRQGLTPTFDQAYAASIGGYPLNSRLMLDNGDIVQSTIANNINNPNNNMTGWSKTKVTSENVSDSRGISQQEFNNNFVTPEMFGAKANDPSFDNTTALNAAFATGKDVYSTTDKTYYVTMPIKTKGQKVHGGFKIVSNRDTTLTVTADSSKPDQSKLRFLYVGTACDLVDFLFIKSLGINTILHYLQFKDGRDYEKNTTLTEVLDTITTAGLNCIVSTFDWVVKPDLPTWVATAEKYECVTGYYLFDEPQPNNTTLADQEAAISAMRALTNKPLAVADGMISLSFTERQISPNFDMLFLDLYSPTNGLLGKNPSETAKAWMQESLSIYRNLCPNTLVIPCTNAFLWSSGNTVDSITDYVINTPKYANGDFGLFIWDGWVATDIADRLKTNVSLQNLVKGTCNINPKSGEYFTDHHVFGVYNVGPYLQYDFGLQDLQNVLNYDKPDDVAATTNNFAIGHFLAGSDQTTGSRTLNITNGWNYDFGGLLFKGTSAIALTNIKVNNLTHLLRVRSFYQNSGTLNLYETFDMGFTKRLIFTSPIIDGYLETEAFRLQGSGGNLMIEVLTPDATDLDYRGAIKGIICNSNW